MKLFVFSCLHLSDIKWLLVFDNAEQIHDLDPYLPMNVEGRGFVIITSRVGFEDPGLKNTGHVEVEGLNQDDSVTLLLKYSKQQTLNETKMSAAKGVSALVGGLPLAITIIAGYLTQPVNDIVRFHETLERSTGHSEHEVAPSASQVRAALEAVLSTVLRALPEQSRQLVEIFAFLNPDHIHTDMFKA